MRILVLAILATVLCMSASDADELNDQLFARAIAATTCKPVPNNGMYCTYKFGDILEIGIKEVGGPDTVVGFHHSDIKNELYAVLYFGCIAVVPGHAHPRNYNKDYSVFISHVTGQIYRTLGECKATLH